MAVRKAGYICTCRPACHRAPFPKDKVFHEFTFRDHVECGLFAFGLMALYASAMVLPIWLF